jgi:hypothetical protein
MRMGTQQEAGVEVRVRGLVRSRREGKLRTVELLNIQNTLLGEIERGREMTSSFSRNWFKQQTRGTCNEIPSFVFGSVGGDNALTSMGNER